MSRRKVQSVVVSEAKRIVVAALCAAAVAVFVAPRLASAHLASLTSGGRSGCVLCDACNAGSGNHITANGGGRSGVEHPCFEGSTCLVHDFNSACGGESDHDVAEIATISWDALQDMDGAQLRDALARTPGRWRVRGDLRTLQLTDCYGNLVASLPISGSQVAAAAAVTNVVAVGN